MVLWTRFSLDSPPRFCRQIFRALFLVLMVQFCGEMFGNSPVFHNGDVRGPAVVPWGDVLV